MDQPFTSPTSSEKTTSNPSTPGTSGVTTKLFGSGQQNLVLGILTIIILAGSLSVLTYTTFNEEDTDTITVNGAEYTWDELFEDFEITEMDDKEGILLSDIVEDTGLDDPEDHNYKIIAADGYSKTVDWDDMQNGIIQESKECYFSDLPKQFFVKDVVEIEVV